jgi:hypothetical protein
VNISFQGIDTGPHTLSAYGKDANNDILRTSAVFQVQ